MLHSCLCWDEIPVMSGLLHCFLSEQQMCVHIVSLHCCVIGQTTSRMELRVIQKEVTGIKICLLVASLLKKSAWILHVVYYSFYFKMWNASWVSSRHSFINYAGSAFLTFPPSSLHPPSSLGVLWIAICQSQGLAWRTPLPQGSLSGEVAKEVN